MLLRWILLCFSMVGGAAASDDSVGDGDSFSTLNILSANVGSVEKNLDALLQLGCHINLLQEALVSSLNERSISSRCVARGNTLCVGSLSQVGLDALGRFRAKPAPGLVAIVRSDIKVDAVP